MIAHDTLPLSTIDQIAIGARVSLRFGGIGTVSRIGFGKGSVLVDIVLEDGFVFEATGNYVESICESGNLRVIPEDLADEQDDTSVLQTPNQTGGMVTRAEHEALRHKDGLVWFV